MTDSVLARVAALTALPIPALKQQWRDLFETEPPPYNRRFLEHRLAYRIQELAYGGLKRETIERLRAIAEDLNTRGVTGGIAVAAHGYLRGTKDVDIIPEPSRENLERLASALTALEASQDLGDFRADEMPLELNLEGLGQGDNWFLSTRYGRLDLIQTVEPARSYAQLREAAI